MKKLNRFLSASLFLSLALPLTGCAKEVETSFYGLNSFMRDRLYGDTVCKIDVSVYGGEISKVSIDETFTPNVWARVSEEDSTKLETIKYAPDDEDPIYFAKYIKIDGQTWIGQLRDPEVDSYPSVHHEYVRYYLQGSSQDDATYDFLRYLSVPDSDTYKLGKEPNAYFNAVSDGKIALLDDVNDNAFDAEKPNYDFKESQVKPFFPENRKMISQLDRFADWKSSIDGLTAFLKGKKIDYSLSAKDKFDDNYDTLKLIDETWAYNASLFKANGSDSDTLKRIQDDANNWEIIENCTSAGIRNEDALDVYMNGVNEAFASLEYSSLA